MSTTLALFLAARTEEESFQALEAWTKLKSVLVLPSRGGTKRKRSTYKFYEKRMVQWITGLRGRCWDEALDIEKDRQKNRRAARSRQRGQYPRQPKQTTEKKESLKRKFDNAKRFVNVGEYSQAINSLLSNGTAPITDSVLQQLSEKHPTRTQPVRWPRPPGTVEFLRPTVLSEKFSKSTLTSPVEQTRTEKQSKRESEHAVPSKPAGSIRPQRLDIDDRMEVDEDEKPDKPATTTNREKCSPPEIRGTGFPSISATKDDILRAVGASKSYTSGDLQQITTWLLKRATLAT